MTVVLTVGPDLVDEYNANKCVHLTITWKTSPLTTNYKINNCVIKQNNCAKCLGVIITNKLSCSAIQYILEYISTVWSPHLACDINKLEITQQRSASLMTSREHQV